ncbi:MAG: hypothetical protein WC969_09330 [Elusimicrobiota bacterium]|jgi:hypothetical protein
MTRLSVGAPLALLLLSSGVFAQSGAHKRLELPASLAVIQAGAPPAPWLQRAIPPQGVWEVPSIGGAHAVTPSPLRKTGLSVPPETRVTPLGPVNALGEPDVRLDLSALKDRHWHGADGFDTPAGRVSMTISFSLQGNPYLAVRAPDWKEPVFHRFEMGMRGDWRIGGTAYRLDFDVSIFRPKASNIVQVFRAGEDLPVYKHTILELQKKSYITGAAASLGRHHYRFFHADDVDSSANPTRPDPRRQGLVFIENAGVGTGGFAAYIVDASMVGPEAQGFFFDNGQTVAMRTTPDGTLEVFDLSK